MLQNVAMLQDVARCCKHEQKVIKTTHLEEDHPTTPKKPNQDENSKKIYKIRKFEKRCNVAKHPRANTRYTSTPAECDVTRQQQNITREEK